MVNYHRISAHIRLDNIFHNVSQIRKRVGNLNLMMVIKADAYGHGAAKVAHTVDSLVDSYAVAVIEEAEQLRKVGITKPIVILGVLFGEFYREAIENDVTLSIFTITEAQKLSDMAISMNTKAKIYIPVDTGMSRIGVSCDDEGIEIIKSIVSLPGIVAEGLFSHYATADEEDKTFSHIQRERFDSFCQRLDEEKIEICHKTICNSAAILDMPETVYDTVRPGIISYGFFPSDEVDKSSLDLRPAMELKARISYVKKLPAGVSVSYGRTYVTPSDRIIATVPVGYADGYPRLLSGKGRVIVNGKYAPIVGRICMDQFMIDVTDIDGVEHGCEVILMGRDGDCFISAEEIARYAETINYEIICGIGKRVPRVYFK